jgi:hypothetical protein
MQVLCKISNTASDVRCRVCGQGFLVYWSRTSRAEQAETRTRIIEELADQHLSASSTEHVHPRTGFNLPAWSGMPKFSGAALLGGAKEWAL